MRTNDQPVGDVIRQVVRELNLGPRLAQSELRTIWARELGPMINKHTTEVSFRGDTLHVHVNSAPLRQELVFNRAHVIAQLNAKLSEPCVREMVVR